MIRQPQLAYFLLEVNAVLDTGKYNFSFAEIKEQVQNRTIIQFLREKCEGDIDFTNEDVCITFTKSEDISYGDVLGILKVVVTNDEDAYIESLNKKYDRDDDDLRRTGILIRFNQEGGAKIERNVTRFDKLPKKVDVGGKGFQQRQDEEMNKLKKQSEELKDEIHD